MRKQIARRLWDASVLAACVLGWCAAGPATAQPALQALQALPDERLRGLFRVHSDDATVAIHDYCVQRVPETRAAWDETLAQWRSHNRVRLEQMRQLREKIDAALRAHPPVPDENYDAWVGILSSRLQYSYGLLLMMSSLDDAGAKHTCEDMREKFSKAELWESEAREGREAAQAALEIVERRR